MGLHPTPAGAPAPRVLTRMLDGVRTRVRARGSARSPALAPVIVPALVVLASCADRPTAPTSTALDRASDASTRGPSRGGRAQACDADDAGLTLPPGFCATTFATVIEPDGRPAAARHLAVTPSGDVFVAINSPRNQQPAWGVVALRDRDADGRADEQARFSERLGGSGLAWADGRLYLGANDRVLRFRLADGQLRPDGEPEVVVGGLPATGDHISKTVVLGDDATLFVNIGSASNSCQVQNRVPRSPGVLPCPELPVRAGVWRFDARGTNQSQADGVRHATGVRNAVALALHPRSRVLWAVPHGRDQLFEHWGFSVEYDAEVPSEEMLPLPAGADAGWPYCYFDAVFEGRKVLAPEYGGDGRIVRGSGIDCSAVAQPAVNFGAHWAPNGLLFHSGRSLPERYRYGAFVAFHGGFDRAPLPNEGYQVQFVPFDERGRPAGPAERFADGFAGPNRPLPQNAQHRPVGVAEGPDGALYVSDDRGGRIYRIVYVGAR